MPSNFSEFFKMMDERHWFRMLVCMLPGLAAGKLAGTMPPGSALGMIATLILVAGVVIYVFWNRLRARFQPADEEVDEEADSDQTADEDAIAATARSKVSGVDQLALMSELRILCGEQARESDLLIETELAVNPHLTYGEATRAAVARRRVLSK